MKSVVLAGSLMALAAHGHAWAAPSPGSAENLVAADAEACAGLAGSTFVSLHEYEVGLGPNGPVLGHWSIRFAPATFRYAQSDYLVSGSYRCQGPEGKITADVPGGGRKMDGFYLRSAGLLLWDGRWFQRRAAP